MSSRLVPRLHVVTDDAVLARSDFVAAARRVLRAGGADLAFHVRGPHTSGATVYEKADALLEVAEESGVRLVLNDRIDVMLGLGHDGWRRPGVHLGRRSLPADVARQLVGWETLMGCSTHNPGEAEKAVAGGADYVFFGHVFATPSHEDQSEAGLDGLAAAVRTGGDVPVVAIGGIDTLRVDEVLSVGAYGVAVLRGVWDAAAPEDAVRDYISILVRASGSAGEAAGKGGS